MAYRRQRCFPPALGAESTDTRILVRRECGTQAGRAHRFGQNRRVSVRSNIKYPEGYRRCERRANRCTPAARCLSRPPTALRATVRHIEQAKRYKTKPLAQSERSVLRRHADWRAIGRIANCSLEG
jgi:hypothetical protein